MEMKKNKLVGLTFFLSIFLIISSLSVSAEKYYADIDIVVDDSGLVDIEGITNYPNLLVKNSDVYTYKKQSYWLLNISTENVFSDFIYRLTLPEGTSINYIKASGFRGIEEESGNLIVTGSGGNESLSIVVQYQIDKANVFGSLDTNILLIFVLLILFLSGLLIYLIYLNKRKKDIDSKPPSNKDFEYNLRGLTNRQKEIVKLLIETKRPLTQTEIQKELNIPKAAVSRNIHSLEVKGFVDIEKVGMSNRIRLKKP